jgi:ABC-2 type transport system permease protein
MMRLTWVEFRRYAARRTVRAAGALALLAILIAATVVFINSDNSPSALRSSERDRLRAIAQCEQSAEAEPADFQDPADCEGFFPRESFDPRFHLSNVKEVFQGLSFLLVIIAMGLGATFMGAEWSAGTMTTILTWEPRRARVFTAKIVGGIAFVFVAVITALVTLLAFMAPIAMIRGSMEGVDGAWLVDVAGIAARSALTCGIAAVIGMAIASVARNTGAALIVAFAYFAVIENVLRGFRPNWARWLIGDNLALFVIGREETGIRVISESRALVTILVYSAIFYLIGMALFRSRDVT